MATLTFSLSAKTDKGTGLRRVLLRFVLGSRINQRAKSSIFIPAEYWDADRQAARVPGWRLMNAEQRALVESLNAANTALQNLRAAVMEAFIEAGAGKQPIAPGWLAAAVDRIENPDRPEQARPRLLADAFADYLAERKLSGIRVRMIQVIARSAARFEAYRGRALDLDTLTAEDIRDFEEYQRREAQIVAERPDLLEICPESREQQARGENTIAGRMVIVKAVLRWQYRQGRTDNRAFERYAARTAVYGTPYYITIEERERIYRTDLSRHPALAVQRDIFVFQCLTGCRVSDLNKLTRANVVNGAIEYIPTKTKEERGAVVRVPLNRTAREIVDRYADESRAALLPFIASQKYNEAIKRIFLAAGLTRPVTILDPLTRQEVQRPLNEIASSHLARRTFIGNLYKQVKDPNLIAKLSGHSEGSKAFARYRDIDEEMRIDLVKLLEK